MQNRPRSFAPGAMNDRNHRKHHLLLLGLLPLLLIANACAILRTVRQDRRPWNRPSTLDHASKEAGPTWLDNLATGHE